MNVAYLIASHTNPAQVLRLVRRIRAERPLAPIAIHHDQSKSHLGRSEFGDDPHLVFVEPVTQGEWGTFSLVRLVLDGIDRLFESGEPFEWVTLLSGQDYPLRSLDDFEQSLENAGDGAIVYDDDRPISLERYRFAYYRLPRRLETRTAHRFFFILQQFNRFQPFVRFKTGRVGCRIGLPLRSNSPLAAIRIFKGFQWWTLSRRALAYVRSFVVQRPDVVRWFAERVIVPDEAFFQTVLMTSGLRFVSEDGRYAVFETANAMNPRILTVRDLPAMLASAKFFARKFDERIDAEVLDRLDSQAVAG